MQKGEKPGDKALRPFLLESGEIQIVIVAETEDEAIEKLFDDIDRKAEALRLGHIIQCTSVKGVFYKATNTVLRRRASLKT